MATWLAPLMGMLLPIGAARAAAGHPLPGPGTQTPATQPSATTAEAPDSPVPDIEELGAGLHLLTSSDSNRVARVTSEGVVIAGELTPAVDEAVALIDGISDLPVRYFIETHRHGNEPVPLPEVWESAKLVALDRQKHLAGDDAQALPPRPDLTFTRGLSLFLGEAEVQIHHFATAHTAGDAAILFPDLGVLYAGDLVVEGMPFIDYAAGGSSRGWVESLDGILALDFETIIPGTGPALTRSDVQTFRDRLVTLRMRTMQLLYRKVAREEALSLLETTDLEWPLLPRGPFASRSFAALYDEMAVEREEAREAAAAEPDEAVEETVR